jgi:hypothetical protein
MRLADDTRGRIPFALVGVLLLLGSTTYATTLATDGVRVDRDVEVAMDRATAASETALRAAVSRAARDAARTPVVTPASNSWGDVLNDSRPFRDSLRVRIYATVREGFDRAAYTHGDVTAAASLPATPTPEALDAELDRISVVGVENGTALRVTIRNVPVVARQDGRVVARETRNRTVTVATPVLAMHDRTIRFERSLERGPLQGRGLGRRLTARLYPLAWARGYAQWSGLPISNVLSTRHVGVATNGAVLELQREAYGRSDPTGRVGYAQALVRLGVADARQGVSSPATNVAASLTDSTGTLDPNDVPERVPRLAASDAPDPDDQMTAGVNETADRAFVAFLVGSGGPALDDTLARAYSAELRARTTATLLETESWPRPRAPSPGATLEDEMVDSDATVAPGDGPLPPTLDGWTRFRNATREVTVTHRIERTWVQGNETVPRTATVTERYAVGVAVDARPTRIEGVPDRPIDPLFERGGTLDGPNLADVPDRSTRFVADHGGVESIAARRALAGAYEPNRTVTGDRPADLDGWVYDDLASLRREVRNVSVAVPASRAATGSANPSARLADRLRERRSALVAAPPRYDGVADRARVAARAAYLDRVIARLDSRTTATTDANARLVEYLRTRDVDLPGRATDVLTNRTAVPRDSPPVAGPLGGEDVFVPQGGPAYLDVRGINEVDAAWTERTGTGYPLATRNVNVFTVPYGDAADAVVGSVAGVQTVRLHTAALTLRAAENVATADAGSDLRTRRTLLRNEINDSLVAVDQRVDDVLLREASLGPHERRRAVDDAFARWDRPSARALAVTNGSFVPAIVDEAGVEGRAADRLRVHLRVAVADLRDSPETRVDHHPVNSTASTVRRVSTTVATETLGTAVANGTERLATRAKGKAVVLPAGLPLLPTPANWYATVNVWTVSVRGEYPRFAVRSRRGAPGETVTYVRDGGVAALDLDGDGGTEALGTAERVDVSVRTVVVVAVPPGKLGVGDTDGQAVETSPGWGSTGADPE